jgi:hypothetical protein
MLVRIASLFILVGMLSNLSSFSIADDDGTVILVPKACNLRQNVCEQVNCNPPCWGGQRPCC